MTDNSIQLSLEGGEFRQYRAVGITRLPALAAASGLGFWLAFFSDAVESPINKIIFFGLAMYFLYACVLAVKLASIQKLRPASLIVSTQSITRHVPGMPGTEARWENLEFVSFRKRILYFSDGTEIPLRFGVGRVGQLGDVGELSDEQLNQIIDLGKGDSELMMKFAEFEAAKDPWWRFGVFFLFMLSMISTVLLTMKYFRPYVNAVSFGFLILAFAIILAMERFSNPTRRSLEESCRPPDR